MPRMFSKRVAATSNDHQKRKKTQGKTEQSSSISRESKNMKLSHASEEEGKEGVSEQPSFKLKRRKGESTRSFLQRVDQETNERILAVHKKLKKTSERRKK